MNGLTSASESSVEPKKESQVSREFALLNRNTQDAKELSISVLKALSPVLRQVEEKEGVGVGKPEDNVTDLARAIRENRHNVEFVVCTLRDILRRLEL